MDRVPVAMSDLQILPKSFGTITSLTASIGIPPILPILEEYLIQNLI
jgi:hypothetical protein